MKKMTTGKFKARCLAVIEEVQTTGEPVVVRERGAAMVKVVPAAAEESGLLGFMVGEFKITGGIESPVFPVKRWESVKGPARIDI
jgi:antitoxin (DNA-binding transcriptional repressor) of toxin-antitoxin stability system